MSDGQIHPDSLKFASLAAHQLKSPITAIQAILRTLLGGYEGKLTDRQKELIARADARCGQASESVRRMLAIARILESTGASVGRTDIVAAVRRAVQRHHSDALNRDISIEERIDFPSASVRCTKDALTETLDIFLDNALKYTPDHGRVRITLSADESAGVVRLLVADSGVGIPEAEREKVFEPFYRTRAAENSTYPGTGLGLAFAQAVIATTGGNVRANKSDLGGTEISVSLPIIQNAEEVAEEGAQMTNPLKVVIVGGVAAGPKVASKVIRLMPQAEVTIIEKGELLSYAGCGLPYYVSGVVKHQRELMETPVGVVRDPVFFQQVKNVRVLNQTEAVNIDRANKKLKVQNLLNGDESWLDYDKLVLATGASPTVPPIPGVELENIFTLHGVNDAEGIKQALSQNRARDVVIVGGGLIGVEVTQALVRCGCRVTIVEMLPQTLRILDWEMARLLEQHMESQGVRVLTKTRVERFEGDGKVESVVTDDGTLPADMVIMAIGVRPNVNLAQQAGLQIGKTGAIKVDDRMRTSDEDIYAAGDCVECTDLLTEEPCYVPLGSTANKQGRVAANSLCGFDDRFPGVLGSTVCEVFDYCVARTGLTETQAREHGYDVVTASAPAPDKAHFMPTAKMLLLKLVADRKTRRLLGVQAIGPGAGDKRIDVAAMAITAGMTVDQLANADLCYAPPYAPAMDNIITAANVVRNKLDGHMTGVTAAEVHRMLEDGKDFLFLDTRSPGEYEQVRLPGSTLIPLGALRGRLEEIPRDKEIVAFCKVSLRGYEAALVLQAAGFKNVRVLDGGVVMWPYEKLH